MKIAPRAIYSHSVCSTAAYAQAAAGAGAVTGTVRELSGDGIPDTTVILYNESLGFQRIMTTTDDGVFTAPSLVPAPGYGLKVTRKGFSDWETRNFEVWLGRTLNFKITLPNEKAAALVEVGTALAQVDDLTSGVSAPITQGQVDTLPSYGRRLETLALLAPGVSENSASGALAFLGEPFLNAFLTDGISSTNTYYLQKPGIAPQIAQDSVAEMQVLPAGGTAEFGNAMGGFVNAVTRTGTNAFHGAAYDYFQNASWNATDRFAPGFNLEQRQNQGGGSVGGPILPGRLFFFANVEFVEGSSGKG